MSNQKGRGPYGGIGGYLDDSLDEARIRLILVATLGREVDTNSFIDWLGRELAGFRHLQEVKHTLPGIVQDEISANRLEADISKLLRDLDEISPTLADRLDADLSANGRDEVKGITGKLIALKFSLLRVETELRHSPKPGRGRKGDALRDQFLDLVADRLSAIGASKSQALSAAAEILNACDVKAPDGGRTRPDKRIGNN